MMIKVIDYKDTTNIYELYQEVLKLSKFAYMSGWYFRYCYPVFVYLCGMFENIPQHHPFLLQHQPNFRDIGGMRTLDGHTVKTGLLYRSGDLSRLSEEDIRKIEEIGIRMIIDFRSDRELMNYPTPRISTVKDNKRITIIDSARETAERMMVENDKEGLETLLVRDYRRMVRDHQDDLREFFRVLATTVNLPLVYHCAAGKDRTGLASYLLLIAVGVTAEDAWKDYFLSNEHLKPVVDKIVRKIIDAGNPNGEIIRPLMEVRTEYLDAALDEINDRYGTIDIFLTDVLHADRPALKRKYLR